ncbi:MAG: dihydroorotase [Desulfohalobiaceae bacterium]
MSRLVVQNVRWQGELLDLYVAQGMIAGLSPAGSRPPAEASIYPGQGCLLLPGLIDVHTHLREPGFEYKEDIASGLHAAAAGGFSRVMTMANTEPVNDSAEVTRYMLHQAKQHWPRGPFLHPVGALSKGLQGKELSPMQELAAAGCAAFSNDGLPLADSEFLRRALEYSSDLGLRVIDHCEDPGLAPGWVMNEGLFSSRLGLKGQPSAGESIQVARDIQLCSYLQVPIHLAHISCRESVELIYQARQKSLPVTAETCPHYLLWDESLVQDYNPLAKVSPPLRSRDDVLALQQAVREGILQVLATDHAPHAAQEKELPFAQALNGISGLDTALSLLWSLLQQDILQLKDLLQAFCYNPGQIFSLPCNRMQEGDPADFILFDPDQTWKVSQDNLYSKGKNTPCLDSCLLGLVQANFVQGELIFSRQQAAT